MVFTDYMASLKYRRVEVMHELEKLTLSSYSTVFRWTYGKVTPPPLKREIIAKHLGIPVDELFPPKDNVPCSQK